MLIDKVEKPQLLFHVELNPSTHHDARNLDQRGLREVQYSYRYIYVRTQIRKNNKVNRQIYVVGL